MRCALRVARCALRVRSPRVTQEITRHEGCSIPARLNELKYDSLSIDLALTKTSDRVPAVESSVSIDVVGTDW